MTGFHAMDYPRNIAEIIALVPVWPLEAGVSLPMPPNLEPAMTERLFGGALIANRTAAQCCRAGLLLLCGHDDVCHEIVQPIGTSDAAFWHAMVHRRDGDHGNALYWYRRAGEHPVFAALAARATSASLDPEAYLRLCRSGGEEARALAQAEWEELFRHCYRKAVDET